MTRYEKAATSLAASSVLCLAFIAAPPALAAPQQPAATTAVVEGTSKEPLEEVVITGSLIPRIGEVTAVPTTSITAEDLVNRGYVSIADALQQQVYSTGSVQGAQFSNGFTPGVQTLSMFGLSPSYTKFLIDGLPMADYPALYNGTEVVTNISGVPEDLVDHIDILPGGQSSLYGSDAIAGVVNVVMKKNIDEPIVKVRLGGYKDGGGTDRRITAAAGHTFGDKYTVMGGIEYEKIDPIWGYQRDWTSHYFGGGTGPAVAERDWLVNAGSTYYFMDPNNCNNVTSQYWGSVDKQTRAGRGDYCGTFRSGENTIGNSSESTDGYVRATGDFGPALQLYADGMVDHEITKFSAGSLFWDTTDVQPYGVFYDPNVDDFLNLQHIFSPEEEGGVSNTLNGADTDAWRGTLGAHGDIGQSHWTYDLGYTYTQYKLTEGTHVMLAGPVDAYYASILGPSLGTDPYQFGVPAYAPDYAKFYTPVSQSQYASMSTYANSNSRTTDSMVRGQLTNSSLFNLPGGPVGLALVAETGNQDWNYTPDPGFLDGTFWGYTAVAGNGSRSRYAFTAEVRAPLQNWLTLTGSTRYDSYHVNGQNINANTYNVGIEIKPVESLLLRGRVGTAFRMPSLADEYQGLSGYYTFVSDYYSCYLGGTSASDCSPDTQVKGYTSGSTNLQPIKANVSSIGLAWSPTPQGLISMDYLHWNITNEVQQQDPNRLLLTESECRQGILDVNSPTCVDALTQVVRDGQGTLVSVSTPKINISSEVVNAFVLEGRYGYDLGAYGNLQVSAAWTDMLTHTQTLFPGDVPIDTLTDPTWSTEFKSKVNGSVTWNYQKFTSTVYFDRHGGSPNYAASQTGYGAEGAGTLHPWTVTNLHAGYSWSKNLEFSVSVLNVFNVMPPIDRSYPGTISSPYNEFNYNVYGLSYYGQVSYQFGSK